VIPRAGTWQVVSTRHVVNLTTTQRVRPTLIATIDVEWRVRTAATSPWPALDLELTPVPETYLALSFRGLIREGAHETHRGQCDETIGREFTHDPQLVELVRLWRRWHLNDMRAGTRVQEVAVRAYRRARPHGHGTDNYAETCRWLDERGLLRHGSWVPKAGALPVPYVYGTAWLVEVVPDAVAVRLDALLTAMKARQVAP
jgi:hypothetical protein